MGKSSELPELKLGIAAMGLLPALAEPNLGGLTAAFCPELPDLKLGTAALGLPPTPAESGLGGLGFLSKLPDLKLGTAALGLPPTPAESDLGGLGFLSKLPDLKLGTAALGLPPTPAESGLGGLGFLSELPDLKLGTAALGLPPTPTESSFGGLIAGLFHELPELEYGDPTEPLLDVVGHAEVDWPVTPYQENRTSASLEYTLGVLNPAFVAQYRGWIQRSEERGPDWLRQAAASIRTLLLGLLHAAAPDNLVLPWVTKPDAQLDGHGHPTRRTKIAWLCRSIQDEGYRKFVRMELDSALAVLDLLNQAVHMNEFLELEESFSSVSARARFAIRHIARLWEKRRST